MMVTALVAVSIAEISPLPSLWQMAVGAVQRYRLEALHDPRVLGLASFLLDYPVASRLYPRALETLAHVGQWGRTVILSDGDAVLQPRKIRRTGIWDAVEGRVLIYVHKERMLDDIKEHYPAQRYVMIEQDRIGATVYARAAGDWNHQILIEDSILALPEIGVEFALAELYEGLAFERDEDVGRPPTSEPA